MIGSFRHERSEAFQLFYVIEMCFSGKTTRRKWPEGTGTGRFKGAFRNFRCREIEKMIEKAMNSKVVYEAMAYKSPREWEMLLS